MTDISHLNTAKSMLSALKSTHSQNDQLELVSKLRVLSLNLKTIPPSKFEMDREEFLIASIFD